MERLSLSNKKIDMLMIEIDGEGWMVIDSLIGSNVLRNVKQISMQIRYDFD